MKTPYSIDFGSAELLLHESIQTLPAWCRYPLHFVRQREQFRLKTAEVVRQQLNHHPFHFDLIQAKVSSETSVGTDIHQRQLFLYFMLEGQLLFATDTLEHVALVNANTFQMSFLDPGRYQALYGRGNHIALTISVDLEWLESINETLPNIRDIVQHFNNHETTYDTMPSCRLDNKIQRWLHKILSYTETNIGAIDGNLRKYISYLLVYYDSELEAQKGSLARRVKAYLDEHYTDSGLSVKSLAEYFFVTERTLLNHFKRQYQTSVQQYYTNLRMAQAVSLLERPGVATKDVYIQVGYTDESSFRHALSRYINREK